MAGRHHPSAPPGVLSDVWTTQSFLLSLVRYREGSPPAPYTVSQFFTSSGECIRPVVGGLGGLCSTVWLLTQNSIKMRHTHIIFSGRAGCCQSWEPSSTQAINVKNTSALSKIITCSKEFLMEDINDLKLHVPLGLRFAEKVQQKLFSHFD